MKWQLEIIILLKLNDVQMKCLVTAEGDLAQRF